jgi:hypothetical protein
VACPRLCVDMQTTSDSGDGGSCRQLFYCMLAPSPSVQRNDRACNASTLAATKIHSCNLFSQLLVRLRLNSFHRCESRHGSPQVVSAWRPGGGPSPTGHRLPRDPPAHATKCADSQNPRNHLFSIHLKDSARARGTRPPQDRLRMAPVAPASWLSPVSRAPPALNHPQESPWFERGKNQRVTTRNECRK